MAPAAGTAAGAGAGGAPSTIARVEFGLSPETALIAFALGAGVFIAAKLAWRAGPLGRPTQLRVGEQMTHARAVVLEWAGGAGYVSADGERWRAVSKDPLAPGDSVAVTRVDGLELEVKKA